MKIKKINSSKFTWELWGGRYFGINEVLYFDSISLKYKLYPQIRIIGYCNSNELYVRPRKIGYALLFYFNKDNSEYWIHISPEQFEDIS